MSFTTIIISVLVSVVLNLSSFSEAETEKHIIISVYGEKSQVVHMSTMVTPPDVVHNVSFPFPMKIAGVSVLVSDDEVETKDEVDEKYEEQGWRMVN